MNKKNYVAVATLAFAMLTSCAGQKEAKSTSGIDLANMDTTVSAGTDFFRYACGGWNDAHPLTAEYSRYGTFDELFENSQKQLRELIEGLAAQKNNQAGSAAQKIGDLYNMAMDSVTLNKQGAEPVKAMLDKIAGMKDKSEIVPMMTEMAHIGIGTYFHSYVYADPKNSSLNIFQMGQGGINLGEKEYYLDTDSITQNIREQYKLYIGKLFQLAGFSEADAQQKVADVMEIETAIAKVSRSATELRDPEANYHKMSFDELKKTIAGIDWDAYMKGLGIQAPAELNVEQVEPIQEVARLMNTLPLSKHVSYLEYNLLDAAASCLSDDFVGVAPAVGDDASRSGRLRTVGDSRPGVVVAEIIAVGRGVVFPVDGGAAVDAVFEQGVVAPRQAALRGFGAVPEGLLVVAVLRFDVQVAAGAEGSEQNRYDDLNAFHG